MTNIHGLKLSHKRMARHLKNLKKTSIRYRPIEEAKHRCALQIKALKRERDEDK